MLCGNINGAANMVLCDVFLNGVAFTMFESTTMGGSFWLVVVFILCL